MKTVFKVINIKKSLKTLLPTLKEKKRYLVFEIISKHRFEDFRIPKSQISSKISDFLGLLGSAKAGIQILKYDKESQKGIMRVNHNHVDELKSALMFIDKIDSKSAIVNPIGVSGILKKAEEKYAS